MNFEHERIQEKLIFELGNDILSALSDPQVIEIMFNVDGKVWVDTFTGKNYFCEMSSQKAHNLLRTMASLNDTEINREHPDFGGEIKLVIDGKSKLFRIQGLIPPIVSSPIFAIRKPASCVFTLKQYEENKILNYQQRIKLEQAIANHKSILIVGGAGSGKTTLANAILAEVAIQFPKERVIIIEDTIELQCNVQDKVQLRTSDHRNMDDLLRYSLRLRPDRIIIGEVRGKEAYSMIKAWNTGHPGGVSTIHANDAIQGLRRVEQLIQEANVVPVAQEIVEAINVVVFITRHAQSQSRRVVKEIIEVQGYDRSSGKYIFANS